MDVKEKMVEMFDEAVKNCGETRCDKCDYFASMKCVDERVADYLIAHGVTVQEWIPVSERLPEEDGSYLVTTNYFGKHQGINIRYFTKDGETVDKYELAGQKYVWCFYDNEYGCVSSDSVTHWQPLPTPPKGE